MKSPEEKAVIAAIVYCEKYLRRHPAVDEMEFWHRMHEEADDRSESYGDYAMEEQKANRILFKQDMEEIYGVE
jgi:hypothetical protein